MNHEDLLNFLRDGIPGQGGTWADLGSGAGAFTLALADLLGPSAQIYSVDRNKGVLRDQERAMHDRFPTVPVEYIAADFTRKLDLPQLDGIVMANSLHFVHEKNAPLELIRGYLRPSGRLILVEYNADRGNMWVPYPLSYRTWEILARQNGFVETRLLFTRPSRFLREMYSALSLR
jgi:ubiquinone/menaquinone biosynthesis C-methylase UbiE